MGQTWEGLLFAHWRVPEDALRSVVPEQLPLDRFDGDCWVGVTPFRVTGLRFRGAPPIPGTTTFPEVNVRTYVTVDDKPGIFFFSLDTPNPLAVVAARTGYRLPYFRARIEMAEGERIRFTHERTADDGPPAAFDLDYEPTGPAAPPEPGTFEHFATERYCLYTLDDEQRVLRGDIHHPPWPVQPAAAHLQGNTMGDQIGLELNGDPVTHFARRQDVVFWRLAPAHPD